MNPPPCRWRISTANGRAFCTSVKLVGPGKSQPFNPFVVCQACFCADHEPEPPQTEKPRIDIAELAAKRRRCGEAKARGEECKEFPVTQPQSVPWACALTTVPQRAELLERTLASYRQAGFPDPAVFVDGADEQTVLAVRMAHGVEAEGRRPRIGMWGNWLLALVELTVRHPRAERYMVVQDDVLFAKNLRAYLDRQPFPAEGYWNLFSFLANESVVRGQPDGSWHVGKHLAPPEDHLQKGCGALALVFSREGAMRLLSVRSVWEKPAAADERVATMRIDGGVANAMNAVGWKEWVHAPSLVWHTGIVSTGDKRPPEVSARHGFEAKVWRRNAQSWRGEGWDALSLLPAQKAL